MDYSPVAHAQSSSACLEPEESEGHSSDSLCKDEEEITNVINIMKITMRAELDRRFAGIESTDIYRLATYLDPRYKSKFFSSTFVTEQVQSSIAALCGQQKDAVTEPPEKRLKSKLSTSQTPTPSTSSTVSEAMNVILSSSSDENDEPTESNVVKEIKVYHKQKRIRGSNEDALKWWNQNSGDFPKLVKIERTYLCCPPSSVPSEQLFSSAGLIYDEKRTRLLADKAEKLLFLKSNLPLLKFNY
ncbi:zinc finger BED domain-containing protein 4-like [Macrobrachium nipponense]|uniref:zinc finger BED domain-containing protein 4-like n=1 Tax=Macrobrachium nipponense TaxID=159736 RepID=UPI0030C7E299